MLNDNVISNSAKWSFFAELLAKIILPVSNMILARLLAPEAFGILATVQMVLSFADMLADAGFQKYIIHKEFDCENDKNETIIVAIYTNLAFSMLIWILICVFRDYIATTVGNPEMGILLVYSGITIPLGAFSSIQLAVLKREFEFKKLMVFRMVNVIVPLFATVPLAILGYGYWSLIIGIISGKFLQSIAVYVKSSIKFICYFSFKKLFMMLEFSLLTLLESILIWITTWCDIFIVGNTLGSYYLGIYNMSMISVNSLFALVSGAVIPVLYSVLCRLQNDVIEFNKKLFDFLNKTALIIIPMGFGVFGYRDLCRIVLFGDRWQEADLMIGLCGLVSCFIVVYCYFSSEVYRSKGMPQVSIIAQVLHLLFIMPVIYCYSYDFNTLIVASNLARFQFILVHFLLLYYFVKINPVKMLYVTWKYIASSLVMVLFIVVTRLIVNNYIYDWFSMLLATMVYFSVLSLFKDKREVIIKIFKEKRLF